MFHLRAGQNTKGRYENSERGYRFSSSVDGIMGEGGEFILYDDPHNVQKAESPDVREKTVDLINLSLHTRVRSITGGIVVIMQRLHEEDYAGSMLKNLSGVVHLCLPARYESDHPHPCKSFSLPSGRVLGGDDRTKDGELLFPGLFPEERLKKLEEVLGSYGSAGQLQQRPAPRKGGMFDQKLVAIHRRRRRARYRQGCARLGSRGIREANGEVHGGRPNAACRRENLHRECEAVPRHAACGRTSHPGG